LRTVGRLLKPSAGVVTMEGKAVHKGRHRELAQRLALVSQGPTAPSGYLVEDLVASGRIPHQRLLRQWRSRDEEMVETALDKSNLQQLRFRELETLSGGQRQRAWIGMALAQDTPALLLDEPTTFLDIAAQIDLLDLVRELNWEEGRSIVMVLHDLNLAARYSDTIVMMKAGEVMAVGTPWETITEELLRKVFEIEAKVIADPRTGAPLVEPIRALHGYTDRPAEEVELALA
jgi:iron complex transport system ATP-binding protein